MFTTEDLKNAIKDGDLDLVIKIFAERDKDGIPLVDINHEYNDFGDNAFFFALLIHPISLPILITLLRIRDYANNPVLRNPGPFQRFSLSRIMTEINEESTNGVLISEILKTKMVNGELVANVTNQDLWTAYNSDDFFCFELLCNIKNTDMTRALDINGHDRFNEISTLLDLALLRYYATPSETNLKWINTILQQGGLRSCEIDNPNVNITACQNNRSSAQLIEIYRLEQEPKRLKKEQEAQDAPELLIDEDGMLKKKLIIRSQIDTNFYYELMDENFFGSLKALHKYYDKLDFDDTPIEKIKNFISTNSAEGRNKRATFTFLNCFKKNSQEKLHGLNLKKIVALVWEGVVDNNEHSFPPETRITFGNNPKEIIDQIVTNRIASFIEKLARVEQAYGHEEWGDGTNHYLQCVTHQLLQVLNDTHVSVYLIPDLKTIIPQANAMAISTICWELMNLPNSEQSEILSSWNIPQSKASEFKQRMLTTINEKLNDYFISLLSTEDRENILNKIKDMPRPKVPNQKLNALLDELDNYCLLTDESIRSKAVLSLRNQATNLLKDPSTNDEQKYETILNMKIILEKLDTLAKTFSTLKMEYSKSANYQTPNPRRLRDIESINLCIQNAYLNYQKDGAIPDVITNLVTEIRGIAVRMRRFGINISNSSLYPLINQKLSTLNYTVDSARQGVFAKILGRQGSAVTPLPTTTRNGRFSFNS